MYDFVARLFDDLQANNIFSFIVKGQGIAQRYEKPLWRVCGDVDLFLDEANLRKAQKLLIPIAHDIEEENPVNLHQAMSIDQWCVELHGTLRTELGHQIDRGIDAVQDDTFKYKRIRTWRYGNTDKFYSCACLRTDLLQQKRNL